MVARQRLTKAHMHTHAQAQALTCMYVFVCTYIYNHTHYPRVCTHMDTFNHSTHAPHTYVRIHMYMCMLHMYMCMHTHNYNGPPPTINLIPTLI